MNQPFRIALWSGPRDIATALLYAFAQREDTSVTDEPLFGYYVGFSGIDLPFRDEVIKRMEIDPQKILSMLVNCDLNTPNLFIKNKSNQAVGLQWDFMLNFKNVFLISSPDRMILANDIELEEQELLDTCFEVQYHQILYLIQLGVEPIVIDTDDLLGNPESMIRLLCKKLNIDYDQSMLSWKVGSKEFESLPSRNWCANIHESVDFKSVPNHLKLLTAKQEELRDECLPYYEKLRKYAIKTSIL